MRSAYSSLLLAFAMALSLCALAQSPPASQAQSPLVGPDSAAVIKPRIGEETNLFSTRVREVNVLFSASNWRGHFVSNLTPSDVRVLDNGQEPQALTYFLKQADLPLRIGILIDVSGSVGHFFRAQQQAALIFLQQTLRPSDSASLIAFADRPHTIQALTSNLPLLTDAVHRLKAGESMTAIYDAVKISCDKLSADAEMGLNRRVLILITDGEDNLSHTTLEQAIDAALQSEVVVFALNTSMSPATTDPLLRKLTENTGGTVLHADGARQLKAAFRKVNEQLRNQYLLGYKPPQWRADHSFHKISLSTSRFGLRVRCRKGYYAVE